MTKVSVVIPCYNQGQFVNDAVDSVLAQTFTDLEIVIVNDGSTDEATNLLLSGYERAKTRVLHTPNCGLGQARNNGIKAASGEYIMPLDADDRIGPTYVEKAVGVLDAHANTGIVYCEAEFFGDRTGPWYLPPYNFPDILLGNAIFATAMFRRSDWESGAGYCAELAVWEDYDFWLSIIERGRDVYRIPEVLFFYRQHPASTIVRAPTERIVQAYGRIMRNHSRLYADNAEFMARHMMAWRAAIAEFQVRIRELEAEVAELRLTPFAKFKNQSRALLERFRMRQP